MERNAIHAIVRGLTDVASAVAYRLFQEGYGVAIHHEAPPPKVHRRRMAFADAYFDGTATLAGVVTRLCAAPEEIEKVVCKHDWIPVIVGDLQYGLGLLNWSVLFDARMRKRIPPEPQRGMAALTIGLGPGHTAGHTADIAIETKWGDRLGAIVRQGATLPLAGEPRAIDGVGRERNVYAPLPGVMRSNHGIGDAVTAGDVVALIENTPIRAPISGTLRGLTRPGIIVQRRDKIVEVDPRPPDRAGFNGLGERPRRIADGVVLAVRQWAEDRAQQRLSLARGFARSLRTNHAMPSRS
jgi:xanthine dehydrogenase accessory factor